jgi:hypothetical protein
MAEAWYPSLDRIAAIIRARLKNRLSGEDVTWSDSTRPTAAQVRELIPVASVDILPCIGDPTALPVKYHDAVSAVVAIRTAMLIELGFFPEQVAADRSAYNEYVTFYTMAKSSICQVMADDPEVSGITMDLPVGNFPEYGWVWYDFGEVMGVAGNDGSLWTYDDILAALAALQEAGG